MPLKKTQIAHFRAVLEKLRSTLTSSLKESTAEVKKPDEATGYSQHQADQGTDDFDRTVALGLTSNDYSILRQIERALEKIQEGSYGICDETQKEIPLARLEAVPYATMTVEAQQKLEKGRR